MQEVMIYANDGNDPITQIVINIYISGLAGVAIWQMMMHRPATSNLWPLVPDKQTHAYGVP